LNQEVQESILPDEQPKLKNHPLSIKISKGRRNWSKLSTVVRSVSLMRTEEVKSLPDPVNYINKY